MTIFRPFPYFGSSADPITVDADIWLAFAAVVDRASEPEFRIHPIGEKAFREAIIRGLDGGNPRDVAAQFYTGPKRPTPQDLLDSYEGAKLLKLMYDLLDEGGGLRAVRHYQNG